MVKNTPWLAPTLLLSLAVNVAATECRLDDYDASVRPDEGVPTDVAVGLFVVDIVDVDDVEQSFRADLFAWLEWNDPRLGALVLGSGRRGCRFPVEDVWNPEISLFNRREFSRQLSDVVSVQLDGRVRYIQRYQGSLRSSLDLHEFPIDHQRLPITAISTRYGPEEVRLAVDEDSFRRSVAFSVAGWRVEGQAHSSGTLDSRSASGTAKESFVRFDYEIEVARSVSYYVWRAIIPLSFIVAMSWAIFWIDPSLAGVQIGLAATAILTVIAFVFSLNDVLPRISYLTRMDLFLFAALSLVFLAFVEAVSTAVLTAAHRETLALSIDRKARVLFPLLFALVHLAAWTA